MDNNEHISNELYYLKHFPIRMLEKTPFDENEPVQCNRFQAK